MIALQSIETKKHGPTDTRGSRISATTASGIRVTIGYPYELSGVDCHALAAETLARKLKWIDPEEAFSSRWIAGGTKAGYVFVDTGAKS
jgi:hypothetical protein